MLSPFDSVANAELFFQIQTNTLTTDTWGNPIPNHQEFTVKALLQPAKQLTIDRLGGLDASFALLEGFMVSPLELPIEIRPPCTGQGIIKMATNRKEKGDVELFPIIQNPYVIAAGVKIVTRIAVKFRSREVLENE